MRQTAIIAAALLVLFIFPATIYAMQNNQLNIDNPIPQEVDTPESARDVVINYIISKYGLNVKAPTTWTVIDTTPEGLLGYQTLLYTSGDWRVVVKHGLTLTPIYSISVQYSSDSSFTWMGTLGTKISNEKYEITIKDPNASVYYTTEDARDMALEFILANHPYASVKLFSEWVVSNLLPEGNKGATKIQYTNGEWTITVSAPVVWKPTYLIEVEYLGVNGFRWSGILPTGGEIAETNFMRMDM